MKNRPALFIALALLVAAPLYAGAAAPGKDFDILNNKNIFSKNRVIIHPRDPNLGPRTTRPRPVRIYTPILIGAMLEDDGYVAFIVDPRSHDITSVRPGDLLPSNAGTLKDVTLDYIITEPGNGKPPTRVVIGQNILGGAPEYPDSSDDASADNPDATGPSTQPANAGSSGPSGAAPADSSGGGVDSIAERLRKRRQQQLGK